GSGANIDLRVGGTLTAGDLFLGVELAVQFPQQNGENVTLAVGNNLIAHNEANSGGIDLEIITPVHQTVNSGANLFLSIGNNLTTDAGGDTTLLINNNINEVVNGANIFAAIGGNLNTRNLTLELLNNGGEIGTGGIVSLAVAGTANITNDATVAIYGSDGAAASGILINGGNYNVGGTFLTYIDGNGAITFNNASVHADVLKAGVFGANGVLNIGGGTLSADTMLKLYAPGSNGQLNFVSNVILGGNST